MSPPVWDLVHVANYEEQWLLRALGAPPMKDRAFDALYDAFLHPRSMRSKLPLLQLAEAMAYAEQVRARSLEQLARLDEASVARAGPLLSGGYVYGMVAQHEQQHVETLLATLQLVTDAVLTPPAGASWPASVQRREPPEVEIPAGAYAVGTDADWAYDNERPRHWTEVSAFAIDRYPVTNAEFLRFIEDGGYRRGELWAERGRELVRSEGLAHPLFWRRGGAGWERRRFARWAPLPPEEPVCHVSWYEADAYARWAGRRLPTEVEWEVAAGGSPDGRERRWPWGDEPPDARRANLWPVGAHPAPVGAFSGGRSAWGVEQLAGDVWEWTSSDFRPYPGFRAYPYREYSEVFFGTEYKVLRGGSWAVAPDAMRNSFRNWDYPIRRQIFTGFRCCRDA
jgi:iron(II)-dependent oxidoreductase